MTTKPTTYHTLKSIPYHHPIGRQLPDYARKIQWLIAINSEEPIHASSGTDEWNRILLHHKQRQDVTLSLSKRFPAHKSEHYEELRLKFDQLRPIISTATPITPNTKQFPSFPTDSSHTSTCTSTPYQEPTALTVPSFLPPDLDPTVSLLIHSAEKPVGDNIYTCLRPSNPMVTQWLQCVYEQYDKNASFRVFTKPL
jgi:hypothetical protein